MHSSRRKLARREPKGWAGAVPNVDALSQAAPSEPPRYVIGIGSSAGGLEALTALLSQLPDALPAPIVIAQHLSPTHRSMMAELLARATTLTVTAAVDGEPLLPDHIYVGPPGTDLVVVDDRICLSDHSTRGRPHPSVDRLFNSLAESYGAGAIAVVLSGTGNDGAAGVAKVAAAGGKVLAQEPRSARYPGMPQAALRTGHVGFQGTPAQIAETLHQLLLGKPLVSLALDTALPALEQLFNRLRERSGVDFSGYKEASIARRLERRIQATRSATLEQYLKLIEQSPAELDRLYQEFLISVTAFFRDPKALKLLEKHLQSLIAEKTEEDEVRVWVAGCATGEEAYTLAILLQEGLQKAKRRNKVRIYASDIDNTALDVARKSRYPSHAIAGLEPELIGTYFRPDSTSWMVTPLLREMVTFCHHDMTRDPPFVRVDLISCRNVLIYFNTELQCRVLELFHAALRDDALLFLGRSETAHQQDKLFVEVDRKAHLYRAKLVARRHRLPPTSSWTSVEVSEAKAPEIINQIARDKLTPGVLLSTALDVEYAHGDVSRFLRLHKGKATLNILALIDRRYRAELQGLLHRLRQEGERCEGREWTLPGPPDDQVVRISASPIVAGHKHYIFLAFETRQRSVASAPEPSDEAMHPYVRTLEEELTRSREHQQFVVEELETSNEELQSLNEEAQATNEELETSNEELQAANEELSTLNEELETKSTELREANQDLENLHQNIRYAVIVLDCNLKVIRINKAAQRLFPILSNEESGLELFSRLIGVADLNERIARTLANETLAEQTVQSAERWYLLRLHPITVSLESVGGAMLTLIDQTDLILATRKLQESQSELLSIMDHSSALFAIKDNQGRYQYANPAFLAMFGVKEGEVLHHTAFEVFPSPTASLLHGKDIECHAHAQRLDSEDVVQTPTGERTLLTTRFLLFDADHRPRALCTQALDITERRKMELQYQAQYELLQCVLDALPANIAVLDARGAILSVNRAWQRFATDNGDPALARTGTGCNYLAICDTALNQDQTRSTIQARHLVQDALQGDEVEEYVKYPCHSPQEQRWFLMYARPLRGEGGGAVVAHMNVTPWQFAEQQRRVAFAFIEQANEAMCVLDSARQIVATNKALTRLTGLRANKLLGKRWRAINIAKLMHIRPREVVCCLRDRGCWQGEILLKRGRDTDYPLWISVSCIRDDDAQLTHYVILISDIGNLRKAEASMLEQAYRDPLTGLSNGTLLMERTEHALAQAARRQKPLALLLLDLDRFKSINERLGHDLGDELLRRAAHRIQETIRRSDIVARLRGDQFVVVFDELRHAEDAAVTAEKLIAALAYPFNVAGHEVVISGSIGITLFPTDAETVTGLLKNANAAMYRAKELGGGRHQFYKSDMSQRSQRRRWLEGELRGAIERQELVLHHQPQYHIGTGRLRGMEALLRWQHRTEGLILPEAFVAVAEEAGVIGPMGDWVLQQACEDFKLLRADGIDFGVFSVNVSAHQLRDENFPQRVSDLLAQAEIAPVCLELELTEAALIKHPKTASRTLHVLREIGVRVALDDFGTGPSSLSMLQRYPISTLKIDRSFVRDITTDSQGADIVQAILAMAKILRLDVVAEGVEAREQRDNLMSWGCGFMQGFLTTAALPLEELRDVLLH